ncbi:MAG TPA: hypothetical protein VKG45_05300 [Actinomycetes bacterium]|nr:hypothetical protein [Actinomycetes bacterium]
MRPEPPNQPLARGPGADRSAGQAPPTPATLTVSSYRVSPAARWAVAFVAVVVLILVTILILPPPSTPDAPLLPRLLILLVFLLAVGFVLYSGLFRVAYKLELSTTELRWYAPLRRGTLALAELREVRDGRLWVLGVMFALWTFLWVPRVPWLCKRVVITAATGQRVVADVNDRGFDAFASDLRRAAPYAQIEVGSDDPSVFRGFFSSNGYRGHLPPRP